MKEIFAMQRANGDWFALETHGRLCVPLFHSIPDAIAARLRNSGMLLFKPVALDPGWLKEVTPAAGGAEVDFVIVNDPAVSLKRGIPILRDQLASLIRNLDSKNAMPKT